MIQTARLENWMMVGGRLYGHVYGHPLHEDGTHVITSEVQKTMGKVAVTRNTVYELGKPGRQA